MEMTLYGNPRCSTSYFKRLQLKAQMIKPMNEQILKVWRASRGLEASAGHYKKTSHLTHTPSFGRGSYLGRIPRTYTLLINKLRSVAAFIGPLCSDSRSSYNKLPINSHESDKDEPSKVLKGHKSIHHLSGSPTPFSDSIVASPSPSLTPLGIDEPSEAKNSEIDSLIKGPSDTFLIGNNEIKFNPLKDIDDPVPIQRVSEKPLDSLDSISETFKMTITNPLFDFDYEFTLNSDNHIFYILNKESDESETETITKE
ncbi:hypothetical protein Tco_0936901, partial [Tanacetum coccineum]